jgi:histidinol-phosphate/aromatic aminotransferase/cobyric acid decarboxylase-like protein
MCAIPEITFPEAFTYAALRKAETIGRPVGSAEWLADMEARAAITSLLQRASRLVLVQPATPVGHEFRQPLVLHLTWQAAGH